MAIIDDAERQRFELEVEGSVAFVNYRRTDDVLLLTYAFVPPALRDRGMGSQLLRETLALVETRGEKVVPRCPFIAAYFDKHPELEPLLAR
jgi:predicted GNAT family acetyltransferase